MAKITISIPEPCNENWNEMTNNGCGKHCKVCDKVVVDFTSMTTNEMQDYFLNHSQQKICGHFKTIQIKKQYTTLQQLLVNTYHRIETKSKHNFINVIFLFMISCALTFTGCNDYTMGVIAMPRETLTGDTICYGQNVDTTAKGLDTIKARITDNSSKMKSSGSK